MKWSATTMTIEELAKKLDKPLSWVQYRMTVSPNIKPVVKWQGYAEGTDFFRVCALMESIGEPYKQPFLHDDYIVMQMSDDFAFLFTIEGKRR